MLAAWLCCWRACRSCAVLIAFDRLCGSALDAVGMAARAIKAGDCDFVIAGGVESMTRAPFVMPEGGQRLVARQCGL